MKQGEDIIYIGLDVDDKAFHGYAIDNHSLEGHFFSSKPNISNLVKHLENFRQEGRKIRICYETTYLGFSLQRDLAARGWQCDVVASSLIPKVSGRPVKTDRLDCKQLAHYYMKGELTIVHVPDKGEESVRDLLRSRGFLKDQLKSIKIYMIALCRRFGIHYREEGEIQKQYWTQRHLAWLEAQINQSEDNIFKFNLFSLLFQKKNLEAEIGRYETEIEKIAKSLAYQRKVDALRCYRGMNTLTAMTLTTEIGDIHRFCHPQRLCSYAGMDLREYSSGGKELRFNITKMGNRHIRTSVIESSQTAWRIPHVSKRLREDRKGIAPPFIEIADRCMKRLYKKSSHLLQRGKERNKVKVACARELLCFVWESLRAAASLKEGVV